MTDQREADLRLWIRAAAATSRPISIDDVMNAAAVVDDTTSSEPEIFESPRIIEFDQEKPMTNKRNLYFALTAAAAAIVLIALAINNRPTEDVGVASQVDTTTSTSVAPSQVGTTTSTSIAPSRVGVATGFWRAMEAGDPQLALTFVDPAATESPKIVPVGRADTLEGVFEWYEVVGWNWDFTECVEFNDDFVRCTASASNLWSEALEVEPVIGKFLVQFSENGITGVEDRNLVFLAWWSPQVFEKFADWVAMNHPDDATIMFDFGLETNQEILDLYELNTARFVESLQPE